MKNLVNIAFVLLLTMAFAGAAPAPGSAKSPDPGANFGKPGRITIDGSLAVDTPTTATYSNAHLVTENGATLDAKTLKAVLNQSDNTLNKVIATGEVKGTFFQTSTGRKYTFYADEAIYDPKLNQVHLTGSVKILIESSYTKGPLTQSGATALVQLGNGPQYPVITTSDVRTTFTSNN